MSKRICDKAECLPSKSVIDIYSVSDCLSKLFCPYRKHRHHNGYDLFNSIVNIQEVAELEGADCTECTLFYYEVHDREFDERSQAWRPFQPERGFKTAVQCPSSKTLQGFDLVSIVGGYSFGCSPLSCNSLSASVPVNTHCLLGSCEEAISLVERGLLVNCDPGPYRIYAVYRCE